MEWRKESQSAKVRILSAKMAGLSAKIGILSAEMEGLSASTGLLSAKIMLNRRKWLFIGGKIIRGGHNTHCPPKTSLHHFQIKSVGIHDFNPCSNKILDKLLRTVVLCVHFHEGAQHRVRTEDEVNSCTCAN